VYHLLKMIANGYIKVDHEATATMTADLLTKSLSRVKFSYLQVSLHQVQALPSLHQAKLQLKGSVGVSHATI